MSYKIIKGKFYVAGFSPDGDSVRFVADNPALWDQFSWKDEAKHKDEEKQLRFEGIDALETHYKYETSNSHQPRAFGIAAMEAMLEMVGIKDVNYNLAMTQILSATDKTPGVIAVTELDGESRPISLVFAGEQPRLKDGSVVSTKTLPMPGCVNLQMIKHGLAYPIFYETMPADLVDIFARETVKARKNKTGIWALDRTKGFNIWNNDTIVNDVVIYPKLFRRLTAFLQNAGDFSELVGYLKSKKDKVTVRSTGEKTVFDAILKIDGRHVAMLNDPDDLIFKP